MQYFGFDRPSFGIKTFGFGSSEFSPLDLFAGGKQGVFYDPSDKSTLYQDVAGTVPVTKDGDPVALMRDKSGNGNHAVQTVSTSRPIYKTDGVLHWLEGDGVDDYHTAALPLNVNTNGLFVASATDNYDGGIFNLFTGSSSFLREYKFQGKKRVVSGNSSFLIMSDLAYPTGNSVTWTNLASTVQGGIAPSVAMEDYGALEYPIKTSTMMDIGRSTTTQYFKGKMFGCLIVNRSLSDNEIDNTNSYLLSKSGVTL